MQVRNPQFEKSLLNKIARVANRLEQEVEQELKVSFSLTFSQFKVLSGLMAIGEASQRELASKLGVTPAVVTRQAEVLGSKGLIDQRHNPRSKRENLIALTKKGEEAVFEAGNAVKLRQKIVLEDLSLQQETALERALDVLIKAS